MFKNHHKGPSSTDEFPILETGWQTSSDETCALRSKRVLIVDDSRGDVTLLRLAFQRVNATLHIDAVGRAEEALCMLRHEEPFRDTPVPDLVITDINLPGINGVEFLSHVRGDVSISFIEVVIFSSFRPVLAERHLPASLCFQKPMEWQGYENFAKQIDDLLGKGQRLAEVEPNV